MIYIIFIFKFDISSIVCSGCDTIHSHCHITINVSRMSSITQTTTVCITYDTAVQVDCGLIYSTRTDVIHICCPCTFLIIRGAICCFLIHCFNERVVTTRFRVKSCYYRCSCSETTDCLIAIRIPVLCIGICQCTATIDIIDDYSASHVDSHILFDSTIGTSAINRVINGTTIDVDCSGSTHSSGIVKYLKTKSTAIDITTCDCTTSVFTNRAALLNGDRSIVLYKSTLTTTIDRTIDFGTSLDAHYSTGG